MSLQEKISEEKNARKIGNIYKVLIDRKEGELFIGRTEYDSPEIDNEVLIRSSEVLEPGNFYDVKIVDAYEFDLVGEVVK